MVCIQNLTAAESVKVIEIERGMASQVVVMILPGSTSTAYDPKTTRYIMSLLLVNSTVVRWGLVVTTTQDVLQRQLKQLLKESFWTSIPPMMKATL